MKKVTSILAVVIFSVGMFSCDSDNTAETDNLYDNIESPDRTNHNPDSGGD